MHLDGGRVQFDGLDLDVHDLLLLQPFKDGIQHAGLGPAIHTRVDGMPVAKALRQAAPLASLLGDVQDSVEHLEVANADIAPLARQTRCDMRSAGSRTGRRFAADGSILGEFAIEKRVIVRYEEIPEVLRNAIIATEDENFFNHIGINLWRIPGALWPISGPVARVRVSPP